MTTTLAVPVEAATLRTALEPASGAAPAGLLASDRSASRVDSDGAATAQAQPARVYQVAAAPVAIPGAPADVQAFLTRVFQHLPAPGTPITKYYFAHWEQAGKPTEEAVGVSPVKGADPDKVVTKVMDVDHYVGNIDHVMQSRAVADDRFKLPKTVRFYQQVDISPIGRIQHELVLVDAGVVNGYRLVYWYMLKDKTDALKRDDGARSQYNVGAWLVAPGLVGYALSSAPKKDDVNFIQWAALTTGADVMASSVIENNIKGMTKWSTKP